MRLLVWPLPPLQILPPLLWSLCWSELHPASSLANSTRLRMCPQCLALPASCPAQLAKSCETMWAELVWLEAAPWSAQIDQGPGCLQGPWKSPCVAIEMSWRSMELGSSSSVAILEDNLHSTAAHRNCQRRTDKGLGTWKWRIYPQLPLEERTLRLQF